MTPPTASLPQGEGIPAVVPLPGAGLSVVHNLMTFQTPAQTQAEADRQVDEERAATKPLILPLAGEVMRRFQLAWIAKQQRVDRELLMDLRQREGVYESETLTKIRAKGGSEMFDNVTEELAGTAEATMGEILLFHADDADDKPWGCDPTPLPELPPEAVNDVAEHVYHFVSRALDLTGQMPDDEAIHELLEQIEPLMLKELQDEAAKRAEGMERAIADLFDEGGYVEAMYAFLTDLCTYKNAFLMGPVIKQEDDLDWDRPTAPNGEQQPPRPVIKPKLKACIERVSPFDVFPDPGSLEPSDGGLRIRRMISRRNLEKLRGTPGVIEPELSAALATMNSSDGGGIRNIMPSDAERSMLEHGIDLVRAYQGKHESFIFWEWFTGQELNAFYGATAQAERAHFEPQKSYHVRGILVGEHIVMLSLNHDSRGRVPVYSTSYRKVAGSFWGKSLAQLIRERQNAINSLARSAMTAAANCSRPRLTVDTDRLVPGENVLKVNEPGCVIQTQKNNGQTLKPVEYFQPQNVAPELMVLRDKQARLVYDQVGLQPYNLGDGRTGDAGKTLGGFSILVGLQSKSTKKAIFNVDVDVTKKLVESFWLHVMLYGENQDIKGDVQIVARGAFAQFVRDEHAQKQGQLLNLVSTNPLLAKIAGVRAVGGMLRTAIKAAGMSTENLPTDQELRKLESGVPGAGGPAAEGEPGAADQAPAGGGAPVAPGGAAPAAGLDPASTEFAQAAVAAAKVAKMQAEQRLADARAKALADHALVEKAVATAKLDYLRNAAGTGLKF